MATVALSIGSRTADNVTINSVASATVSGFSNAWDVTLSAAVPSTTKVGDQLVKGSSYLILAIAGSVLTVSSNPFSHTTAPTTGAATTSRAFSTIASWEAACPTNLVTQTWIWRGELYKEGPGTNNEWPNSSTITIAGMTTSSSYYVELTAAPGQSFADNLNPASDPLRYDATKGVALRATGGYQVGYLDFTSIPNVRLSRVQCYRESQGGANNFIYETYGAAGTPRKISGCIFYTEEEYTSVRTTGFEFVNCLFYGSGSSSVVFAGASWDATYVHCTFGGTGNEVALAPSYTNTQLIRNCLFLNLGSDYNNSSYFNAANSGPNATTKTSTVGSRGTNLTSRTATNEVYNITAGSQDFRAKSTSTIASAGLADTSYTNDLDILGRTRSSTTPTIGAFEVISGGGGPTVTSSATEGSDTAAANVTQINNASSSATEGSDTATSNVTQINVTTSNASEGSDTASAGVANYNAVTSPVTEGSDTATANVTQINAVTSSATESADTSAAGVSILGTDTNVSSSATEGSDTAAAAIALINNVVSSAGEAQDTATASIDSGTAEEVVTKGGTSRKKQQRRRLKKQDWELPYILEEIEKEVPDTVVAAVNSVVTAVEKQFVAPSQQNVERAIDTLESVKKSLKRVKMAQEIKIKLINELERLYEEIEEEELAMQLLLDDD